ncbi:MAG: phage terminase large subunit family protein [Phycisphaera sp.]|nr:MAG: phage terminase large subunit family protein [Phycisphaera sp.]
MVAELDTSYLTREDAPILAAFRKAITPRVRRRPSEWAEANVRLSSQQGADRPGPYDCGYYPWLQAVHDVMYDHPQKKGVVIIKPSQKGITLAVFNIIACTAATEDVSILYLISRKEETQSQVAKRWDPLVKNIPELAERFEEAKADDQRQTMLERPYRGGQIDFSAAGSAAAVSSRTYGILMVDEWDQCVANFPSQFGGLFNFVLGRQPSRMVNTQLCAFSHPTLEGRGIHLLWRDFSDKGAWVFDCPHCRRVVVPKYALIHFREHSDRGKPVPESAELRCGRCGKPITDEQRSALVWPDDHREGGTGRVWTDMKPEQAALRDYTGLALHGLCDPYVSVVSLARAVENAPDERERQSAMNVRCGEGYAPKEAVVDASKVREAIAVTDRIVLPAPPEGVHFVTVGTDVQSPKDNPTLYSTASAWTATGHLLAVAMERIRGWTAYFDWLANLSFARSDGEVMGVKAVGIDDRYLTGQVLEACRRPIYSSATSRRIEMVALGFSPTRSAVNDDMPFRLRSEEKRRNPTQPELGLVWAYDLFRHSWVDRTMSRLSDSRITVVCRPPADLEEHLTANRLRPVATKHNMDREKLEWQRVDKDIDDWAMSVTYSEAVAAIRCRLDSIHDKLRPVSAGPGGRKIMAPTLGGARRGR